MWKRHKPKLSYVVHWIIAAAIVFGALGIIVQLIRWGTIVETGSIGPTGF